MQATTQPIVVGSSILGIKYAGGVMIASDCLCSYGSLARFPNLSRMKKVGENTMIACGGEYSDFQALHRDLDELIVEDLCADDGNIFEADEMYGYITRMLYQRRNKMDPLWCSVLVAGHSKGEPFLGTVDLNGTAYQENFIATGMGMHMALPIIRRRWKADMNYDEAKALLEDCMRVLFYRDCRTMNLMQIGNADASGVTVSEQYSVSTKWDYKLFQNPNFFELDSGYKRYGE